MYIDTDKSYTINRTEIFNFMFKYMDDDNDGVWNTTEVLDFIKDYAKILRRNMSEGWEEKIHKAMKEINNGVSAEELIKALRSSNKDISDLKDIVI